MNEKKIRERLAGTREWIFDPDRVRNRALLEQLRRERELRGLGWPKFDWVWEQREPQGGYHVGPGDPDWAWRRRDEI
jgi:hypothetical protein